MKSTKEAITLILRPSKLPNAGVGVFTVKSIKRGEKVPLFSNAEQVKLKKTDKPDFLTKRFCPYDKEAGGYWCPQNFHRMSIGWYINHSTKPNIEAVTCKALRAIKKGEELTVDYKRL